VTEKWKPVDPSQAWVEWCTLFACEYRRITGRDYHEVPIIDQAQAFMDDRFPHAAAQESAAARSAR
jgi:hypothetical protein